MVEVGSVDNVRQASRSAGVLADTQYAQLIAAASNLQSRLDAQSDAAQLRLYALESGPAPIGRPMSQVLLCGLYGEFWRKYGWPASAYEAAHAAFKAVPELRAASEIGGPA